MREQCERLFEQLVKRDKQSEQLMMMDNSKITNNQNNNNNNHLHAVGGKAMPVNAEFEAKITKIKELCVATFILEMTRTLKPHEK